MFTVKSLNRNEQNETLKLTFSFLPSPPKIYTNTLWYRHLMTLPMPKKGIWNIILYVLDLSSITVCTLISLMSVFGLKKVTIVIIEMHGMLIRILSGHHTPVQAWTRSGICSPDAERPWGWWQCDVNRIPWLAHSIEKNPLITLTFNFPIYKMGY